MGMVHIYTGDGKGKTTAAVGLCTRAAGHGKKAAFYEFLKGAKETLKIAKAIGAKKAILKEGSPSCGCNFIYDGSFSGNKIRGKGLTAYMLEREGIKVISEKEEF